MENRVDNHQDDNSRSGFKSFAFKRFIIAAILIAMAVWALSVGPGLLDPSAPSAPQRVTSADHPAVGPVKSTAPASSHPAPAGHAADDPAVTANPEQVSPPDHDAAQQPDHGSMEEVQPPMRKTAAEGAAKAQGAHLPASDHSSSSSDDMAIANMGEKQPEKTHAEPPHGQDASGAQTHGQASDTAHDEQRPTGVAFVEAVIQPLQYELNEHFWGWRPNDIVNITDNVNNFQKGVLEVTRRSVVLLSERISRTGTTAAFNTHLENAMNWLMVKADRYWFPSPESKYRESIKELQKYKQDLISGKASFYTRSDNIIPLLASYEDLLGSSDENLVKQKEKDGSTVSFFDADDNFFYAKGVASTMAVILEAMHHDFAETLKNRHGEELLHHAIVSCRQAAAMNPLLITDGDLDGIFANHRAHMAAPISHARFYIGQLIKTLST